jgi:iron(III) transport system ATP-binding protein
MPKLAGAARAAPTDPAVTLASASAAVRTAGVTKRFDGEAVLRGVDLAVEPGTILSLLGPSGCGKTTLLRVIAGLEVPDAGTVTIGGATVAGASAFVPPERRRVGMVFQDWALFPHLSVGRNVGFGLRRAERRSGRVEEALELVDLAGFADRDPMTLSGGQRQRVALARALVTRPAVLLLDEPFSNLDAGLRTSVRGEVQRLLAGLGVTTVVVTHDQEEAFVVGDRVAVLLDGEIAQHDSPAELYAAPASRAVAAFVGDPNLVPGVAGGTTARTTIGSVPLRTETRGEVDVLLRPEALRLLPADAHDDNGDSGQPAAVEAVEYYGHDAVYHVRVDGGPPLRARTLATPAFQQGDQVTLTYTGGPTVAFAR